ncbi:hypothetical protein Aduo_002365 [Ancylostoma duodenale]
MMIEACREHQVPLVMTFIDYCKAFDSMKHHTVWESLLEQGVEQKYVDVLKDCYSNCTTTFRPFIRPIVVPIKEDVRQGDPISPNLFSAVLESVIRKSDWDEYGVNVNGRMLKHLRFADDIVLLTHRPQEAEQMVRQLNEEDRKTPPQSGSIRRRSKTEYIYLRRLINMGNDLKPEIIRRRRAAWAAYNTIKPAVSETNNQRLRAELFNSTVIPALCYGSETWTLTKAMETQLRTTQASIERDIVGYTLRRQRRAA